MPLSQHDRNNKAFTQLADKLGFGDVQNEILQQALTHPAFFEGIKHPAPCDNQRLEFLGDAVLDIVVGEYLYYKYPLENEGVLSKMRAAIVCEGSLATKAEQCGIGRALRLGHGSEASGDRRRGSILADAYEAVVGAVYIAKGFEAAKKFILDCFAASMDQLTEDVFEDKKSLLQEFVQGKSSLTVTYKVLETSGPPHAPQFKTGVYWGESLIGIGNGGSKKEAEQAAAKDALEKKTNWSHLIKGK